METTRDLQSLYFVGKVSESLLQYILKEKVKHDEGEPTTPTDVLKRSFICPCRSSALPAFP
ncbi:hypothetical protein DPMN_159552 [Dreissena polymorpha]|uniref:Uncharacterized protein n=1 Tax=Dreissena polymorpha TaxID=45954 RepID=A0A9D4EL69_DREPO|nr:hypothetical protein DPMN_159552 [Dreissena polymorpha]